MSRRSTSLPAGHQEEPRSSPGDIRSVSLAVYLRKAEEEDIEPFLPSPTSGKCELDTATPMESRGIAEVASTLRKATYMLFRFHLIDWLAIFALAILDGILNIINPFYRFVGESMIGDYMFPLKSNTIPFEAVPVIALVIPLVIFVAYFLYTKDITDLHHATLGLFFAVLITAVLTDAIKDAVGRPRPDFFWRCFPDGNATYKNITGEVECHGVSAVIKEGHKSFPSGHTSWSFAGLGFLSLYLAGKLQLFNGRGHVAKLAIVFTPLLAALLVGLSRVDDYWHHWQDVFAGMLLGFIMAALCYHHLFPSILGESSMEPYSFLKLGNNFELACFAWFPWKKPGGFPPTENGEDLDVESGDHN